MLAHATCLCCLCMLQCVITVYIGVLCMLLQTPDEDAALKAIKLAFDNGVNFFDVAPFYAAGKAEEVRSEHCIVFLLSFAKLGRGIQRDHFGLRLSCYRHTTPPKMSAEMRTAQPLPYLTWHHVPAVAAGPWAGAAAARPDLRGHQSGEVQGGRAGGLFWRTCQAERARVPGAAG
jgi:Aldo/keto reductase family